MIKPKSQTFRVKVMLIKLEAVTNRVATRCHASLKVDGEEQYFKATPELKKNVALFNSEVEFDSFSIQLDEVTGLYQNKPALLQIEIETQGTKMRMGEVALNLGGILNEKKYRIVSQYPLAKCYDKTAKVRLSVDFIPLSLESHKSEKKELRELKYRDNIVASESSGQFFGSFQQRRSPNIKSRLAQESNLILQDKIYEYEQKLENYRLSQTQIQEKLYDQINAKDQQITELTIEVNRKAEQLSAASLQIEQLRFRLKEHNDQISSLKQQKKSLLSMIQTLQRSQESTKKQLSVLKSSLENQARAKQSKQKYYSQQLAKYTARYLQSQQERNKIIFELQTKFKEQIQKKESNHRNALAALQKKYEDMINELKHKVNKTELVKAETQERLQLAHVQIKKYVVSLQDKQKEQSHLKGAYKELQTQNQKLRRSHLQLSSQLQTLNFSYNQMEQDLQRLKSELHSSKTTIEQLKMELVVANQTIDEQHQVITKNNRELQVHQEREYYLTQRYNDQLEIKSINEENIIGESIYYKQEIQRIKGQLQMAQERAEDETHKATQLANSIKEVQMELANRGQLIMRLGQEKISLENQIKNVRNQLADMQEAVLVLKEDNMQLSDLLRQKKAFYENDKSLEWSEKIEELQNDISEMVQKFRIEKESMRDSYKREEFKKKEEINQLTLLVKKSRDENEELRRQQSRKDSVIKQLEQKCLEIGQKLKQKAKSYQQVVQKVRLANLQHDQLQKKVKNTESICQHKLRDLQLKLNKELTQVKKLELTRIGYQKVIQVILDYLSRPTSTVVGFQEISFPDVDPEFLGLINLSVKKHCDQRTKVREQIKKLQLNIVPENIQKVIEKKDSLRYLEKSHFIDISEKNQKILQPSFQFAKPKSSSYELDQLRDQNARLKREITEFKKKHRELEEQVSKAERNADIERSERNQAKRELEQAQDEVDKLTFQIKRKDKTVIDYENEIRELQAQLMEFKGQRVSSGAKTGYFYLSRAELRHKEKEEQTSNNRREIVIKDLECRLQTKTKELQESHAQITKLRGQNTNLKDTVLHLNNQLSLLESKYKDRCSKFSSQESQYLQHKNKLEDQLHRLTLSHKKQMEQLAEELLKVQEESIYHQRVTEHLRNQITELEKKIKATREEFKLTDGKNKKEYDFSIARLKEQNNELERTILGLRSELQSLRLRQKEEEVRNGNVNALLNKRTEEIERLGGIIRTKQQALFQLQQKIQLLQGQSERKIEELKQVIEQLEQEKLKMEYELEEYKFTSEGRMLDLERRLEEARL